MFLVCVIAYNENAAIFKEVFEMATASFTKEIVFKEKDSVKRFVDVVHNKQPAHDIDKNLASDKNLERGRQLLTQCLSH